MSIDDARRELSKNADLAAVIKAAEAGNVDALLGLAEKTDGFCGRYRELPPECASRDAVVSGVFQDCGLRCIRSVTTMHDWLSQTLVYQPIKLTFAARDGGLPEGNGGRYFLTFQAAALGTFEDHDGIALIVQPGRDGVINLFTFTGSAEVGLAFAQLHLVQDDVPNPPAASMEDLTLIAPVDVSKWRDVSGRTEAITVARPEYVTPSPAPGAPDGVHPAGTKVGIPAVDALLDKAYAGGMASLARDAVFMPVGCYDSPDWRPCDEGDLPNTPYDVVGVYNCDKHFARSVEELETALKEIDREGRQYLLFVLAPERAPGPYREAAGEYIVGLRTASYPRRTFYLDAEGRLLTVDSCPGSYPNFSYGHVPAEAIVLAPP